MSNAPGRPPLYDPPDNKFAPSVKSAGLAAASLLNGFLSGTMLRPLSVSKFFSNASPKPVLVVPAVDLGADATRFSSTTLPPIL